MGIINQDQVHCCTWSFKYRAIANRLSLHPPVRSVAKYLQTCFQDMWDVELNDVASIMKARKKQRDSRFCDICVTLRHLGGICLMGFSSYKEIFDMYMTLNKWCREAVSS
jgi:hypothetical protein